MNVGPFLAKNIPLVLTSFTEYLPFFNDTISDSDLTTKEFETAFKPLKSNKAARIDIINLWKSKTRVTSYEFKSKSYEFKSTSYEFKSASYEFKSTSYMFKSTSYEFKSTSYEFKLTS